MNCFLEGIAYGALRAVSFFVGKIPRGWSLGFGEWAGLAFFWISPRRRGAYADLKAALGSQLTERERWQVIRRHYGHLGRMAMEVLRFPSLDPRAMREIFHIDPPEKIQEALRENKGAVLMTAHFGNWELAQIGVSMTLGRQIHVLARDQKPALLNRFLNELRQSHGALAAGRGMGIRGLLHTLRRRECVGVLGDQDAGKQGGMILPFFGRKTTVPTGAFGLALRTGAPIVIGFLVRRSRSRNRRRRKKRAAYRYSIVQTIYPEQGSARHPKQISEGFVKTYLSHLENFIRRFPDQWLWESKRWKYSWTKRILILSDGKPGHLKQSEAVAAQFQKVKTQYGRSGLEYPTKVLAVNFKSERHKKIFTWFAFFFLPWAQGRLRRLRFFFTPETAKSIEEASADFVISAGSSLAPLNLCLAKDSCAKSIVLMKPSFPFSLFHYDLAIVPAHDRGRIPEDALRTLLVPSRMEPDEMQEAAGQLRLTLRAPERIKFGIFLGGSTRRFELKFSDLEKIFDSLEVFSANGWDYLVTTSRRTPDFISEFLKTNLADRPSCQQLVIAKEDPRAAVAPGMMALADILIVTSDSISMISEAVTAGKKVIALDFPASDLPAKHKRFRELLLEESVVVVAGPDDLGDKILQLDRRGMPAANHDEEEMLTRRLQEIL